MWHDSSDVSLDENKNGNQNKKVMIFVDRTWGKSMDYYYSPPRRGGIKRWSASIVRPSVRLSDVAYIGSNSKTKRPRKTKLCTVVPQVTCDSHTDFKVKSQGHGAGAWHLAAQLVILELILTEYHLLVLVRCEVTFWTSNCYVIKLWWTASQNRSLL